MHNKLITWLDENSNKIWDVCKTLAASIGVCFTYDSMFKWFVNTFQACITTLIVTGVVYMFMRKLKKKYP